LQKFRNGRNTFCAAPPLFFSRFFHSLPAVPVSVSQTPPDSPPQPAPPFATRYAVALRTFACGRLFAPVAHIPPVGACCRIAHFCYSTRQPFCRDRRYGHFYFLWRSGGILTPHFWRIFSKIAKNPKKKPNPTLTSRHLARSLAARRTRLAARHRRETGATPDKHRRATSAPPQHFQTPKKKTTL